MEVWKVERKKIIILFEIDLFHVLLTQLTYLGQSITTEIVR